ncbi:AAA family ATPase [Hymenobacter sp. DH14]|uniref:AAA family ATPase n=1 Tax=Hymenobacter cyanobacteriorum TaxID=2926463 RepID=A0A9X1VCB8_9BACT|nr:AAA family ATPase [Hymenobacter cyanobacteriorum]MCI1186087.1 AAA family ATPase [Hymenobacter cyanobacteriorum]
MKIISVRFANLNSLPGPFLIRFDETPLADTGLFAITGPTGAGKSTLLDAISVGLYGRVPRHDRQVGEMVSRHAKDAFSEVEFEVHETNPDTGTVGRVRYRARWEVKRKTRGDDKGGLGQDAMTLVMSPSGVAVISGKEAVPARVSELSGLDFGQFEQSVLLSQGKFARFLHAPEKERSALLEKMTNVGIYSRLSVAAFEKAKEEELKTKLLRAKLDATRLLSEEERAGLERQLDELNEATEQHHEEEQELTICLTWRTILDQLDQQLHKAEQEAERLRRDDDALQPEFARLEGHLRAAAVDKPLALAAAAEQELQRLDHDLQTLEQAHPTLAQAAEITSAAVATAQQAHATAEATENRLRPILTKARETDVALAAAETQVAKSEKTYEAAQEGHRLKQQNWQQQDQQLTALAEQKATLEAWLLAHNHENDLTLELGEIKRQLLDLEGVTTPQRALEARQEEHLKTLQTASDDLKRLQRAEADALAEQQRLVAQGRPSRAERDALLEGTDAAALAQREAELTAQLYLCQRLLPLAQTAQAQQARVQEIDHQQATQTESLRRAELDFGHLKTRRDDAQHLLESYQRELRIHQALADLNAHRHQLRDGEPCPLCGALEHAFAADFTAEAGEQEQRVTQQQANLAQVDHELRTADQALVRQQTEQQQLLLRRQEAAEAVTLAQAQAAELATGLASALPDPASPMAIEQRLAETRTAQAAAAATCRRLADLDKQLAELKEQHTEAGTAAIRARGEAALASQRHETAQLKLAELKNELADYREQAANYRQVIQGLLRPHGLVLPPTQPYDGVLATLGERASAFVSQREALKTLDDNITRQQAQQQSQSQVLAEQQRLLVASAAALASEQAGLEQQRKARLADYGGLDPAGELAQLQRQVQEMARAYQHAQAEQNTHQQALTKNRTLFTQLQQQQNQSHATAEARRAELTAALATASFATADEARALLLPAAEAERLARRRQDHHTAQAATARRLADLTAELHHHAEAGLTPHTAAELTAQLNALSAADDILQQKLGAVGNQLKQDDDARQLLAAGLHEMTLRQQEEQRWQDLSEQIGSARGDKFSQFAQGLTLTHLARLANLRLRQLTGRYTILKTPNRNLELQIVDHDQADTVRPMASLSGGESFLVSLALALGLSELAGHKARIESLFIDEGFGTLDPDALNTALDALEKLQHSGKMIGIISHVSDLKERIGTQIRVRPGAGGNSTVHVVDLRGDETDCAV